MGSRCRGNRWPVVSQREMKWQHSASDSLRGSDTGCLSSPFSCYAAIVNCCLVGTGNVCKRLEEGCWRNESFVLRHSCGVYRVVSIKQYCQSYLPGIAAGKISSAQRQGLSLRLLPAAADAVWHLLSRQHCFDVTKPPDKPPTTPGRVFCPAEGHCGRCLSPASLWKDSGV